MLSHRHPSSKHSLIACYKATLGYNPFMAHDGSNSIDYLIIGHVAKDLMHEGPVIGGTVAYAGRTAHALGLCVGIVTSTGPDLDISSLSDLKIECLPAESSTTFENRYTPKGRQQRLHALAHNIQFNNIPHQWHSSHIIHLGPIADEIDLNMIDRFPNKFVCITPQGWLRRWDEDGIISLAKWHQIKDLLPAASATVLSLEDLIDNHQAVREMAPLCNILAVTDGANGAQVFWKTKERHIPAPRVVEVDTTGAGDIFAAAFFTRLYQTKDPWESAHFANFLAANSVTRKGLASTPTTDEVMAAHAKVNS
jgi:hypothetical protein